MAHDVVLKQPPTTLAYEEVVGRYAPYVWHVARGVLRDADLAADASQEAFLALLAHAEPFEAEPVLRTWLGRVACNAALKLVRSRTRRTAREHAVADGRTRGEVAMDGIDADALHRHVDALEPEERLVVRLKYMNGLPQTEIAAISGHSTGTVSNRMRQALDSLRRALAGSGLAVVLPDLERHLAALGSEAVPSTLVPRLLSLEAPAAALAATGGMTLLTKLLLSAAAAVAATLGITLALPSGGPAPAPADPPGVETALASDDVPPPRLAGRGDGATAPAVAAPAVPAPPTAPQPQPTERIAGTALTVLRGIVFTPEGVPAEGAVVRIANPTKTRPHHRADTVTDRDGRWEVADLPARESWVVAVHHAGGAPWRDTVTASDVETRLHASWSVRGVVTDPRGEPVVGLIPCIARYGSSAGGSRIVADEEGRFEILDLDPRKYVPETTSFELRHPDFLSTRLESFDERIGRDGWAFVDVRLEAGAAIEGRITGPGGVPVASAQLILVPEGQDPAHFSWSRRDLKSDAQGAYAIRGLRAGRWVLRVRSPGLVLEAPATIDVTEREQRSLDLTLGRGRTLKGRVVDGAGRPVPGAHVGCSDVVDSMLMGVQRVTDEEGRFRFDGLSMERRTYGLFLAYLPLLEDTPLDVEVVNATARALEVAIRTKALLPEPTPVTENEPTDEGPVQVVIPSTHVSVTFPRGEGR